MYKVADTSTIWIRVKIDWIHNTAYLVLKKVKKERNNVGLRIDKLIIKKRFGKREETICILV